MRNAIGYAVGGAAGTSLINPEECANRTLMYILIVLIVIFLVLTLAHVVHMYLRCVARRKRLKRLIQFHAMRKEQGDKDGRSTD